MRYTLLGQITVANGEHVATLTVPKATQLFAIMLLERNRHVTTGRIADALWPEGWPRNRAQVTQQYVMLTRRSLASVGVEKPENVLVTVHGGYMLRFGKEDTFDVIDFGKCAERARLAKERQDWDAALLLAEEARGLYTGTLLGGWGTTYFEKMYVYLTEQYREMLEIVAEAHLAKGHNQAAISVILRMMHEDTLNEFLCGLLMTAYARKGERAKALQVFQKIRAELREEVGMDPCGKLKELHQAILNEEEI